MTGKDAPIGVFDSGIGGLTVVKELRSALPEEDVVYLGDTARVPYGIRSPETVIRYSLECTKFLLDKGIKLLVIACNTSSSVALDIIIKVVPVPVIGVIVPGAMAACRMTKNKNVGVIGTEATVRSGSYIKAIKAVDEEIKVRSLPCPLFVPLVEEGWLEGKVPELVASKYLSGLKDSGVDTLVLGCTHYPLLKPVISAVVGEGVSLVDSAIETAEEVKSVLEKADIKRIIPGGKLTLYVTDSPERFRSVGERFLGGNTDRIEKVKLEA